ncbi:Kelch repeat-containing protein [Puia sp. P3]|uniref:Kelch repeat-containing protein n=1 Tax=Puia sp. P3 TaxID=3423952 RepID=UPI003D66C04A
MKKSDQGVRRDLRAHFLSGCVSVIFMCTSLFSFSQGDIWLQKPSPGLAGSSRWEAVSFSIGNKGYVGGGTRSIVPSSTSTNFIDFWEYDPATNAWTQKADLPGARSQATGFSIGSKGYMGNRDFWEYDPATNTWTRKADFKGAGITTATGFSIGNKGYVGTGLDSLSVSTNEFWQYDPATNVWTQKANFGGPVRHAASGFSVGGKGYIGLGQGDNYLNPAYADFWEYDPVADAWTQKADYGGGKRESATGFSIGDKGYIGVGNKEYSKSQNDFWEFDPAANTWVPKANFPADARAGAFGFSIGSQGYIGTGFRFISDYINGPTYDVWAYDTVSKNWSKKADLAGGPRMSAVGFSVAGKGYVGTGYDGSPKRDFWEYDPDSSQVDKRGNFAGGDRRSALGFGIGRYGYVGTGYEIDRFSFRADLWRYDPATNIWALAGTGVPGPYPGRAGAFACRIGDKEYVGGGYYYASYMNDIWEFDPATGRLDPEGNAAWC